MTSDSFNIDDGIENSDWIKANAFDFPGVQTAKDFERRFNIPSEEPARSRRLSELASLPWAKVAPTAIRKLLLTARDGTAKNTRTKKSVFSPLWVRMAVDPFHYEIPTHDYQIKGAYTKPILRNRIKNEILRGGKGGSPGQWSARKAQLLANEYRKAGGGYKTNRPSRNQMTIKKWDKKTFKKKLGKEILGEAIGRKYVRVTKAIKERQKREGKKNDK